MFRIRVTALYCDVTVRNVAIRPESRWSTAWPRKAAQTCTSTDNDYYGHWARSPSAAKIRQSAESIRPGQPDPCRPIERHALRGHELQPGGPRHGLMVPASDPRHHCTGRSPRRRTVRIEDQRREGESLSDFRCRTTRSPTSLHRHRRSATPTMGPSRKPPSTASWLRPRRAVADRTCHAWTFDRLRSTQAGQGPEGDCRY